VAALPINRLASELRRHHAPEEAAALAEQVTLRARAAGRLEDPSTWLLTGDGLEMMTHPLVANRRARRVALLGLPVADLTCGLGGDLRAFADAHVPTFAGERTPAIALLAQANVPSASVVVADAIRPPIDLERSLVMLDPSRRGAAGRRFDPEAFSPTWTEALAILYAGPAGVMKAPPGLEHRHIPPLAEAEFVQVGRSMREAALWVGRGSSPDLRRAVLFRSDGTAVYELDSTKSQALGKCKPVQAFIFDPESCVTRAGLVRHLAHRLGAAMLDPHVAYLTSESPTFDPLCATFEVLETIPFSVARLKSRLRDRGWRAEEVRRCAFPVEPGELLRQLGTMSGDPVTLLLTTLAGKRLVVVARRRQGVGNPEL